MIVDNNGYVNFNQVLEMVKNGEAFSIYETKKKTTILVKGAKELNISLYRPQHDRLPHKLIEGKKITSGVKIFDSKTNEISLLDTSKLNNGNQIMTYQEFNPY